jgi:hypothetical protein
MAACAVQCWGDESRLGGLQCWEDWCCIAVWLILMCAHRQSAGCISLAVAHMPDNQHPLPVKPRNPALPQVTQALAELGDSFGELLSRKRSGVVAALLAACSRLGAAQSAACRALSRGLTGLPAAGVEQRGLAVSCFTAAMLRHNHMILGSMMPPRCCNAETSIYTS